MRRHLSTLLALLLASTVARAEPRPDVPMAEPTVAIEQGPAELAQQPPPLPRDNVVQQAIELLDTAYRYGGTSPLSGLDCSGLVRYVYEQAVGLTLPRSAREMARSGAKVESQALLPGDLLFFARPGGPVSHVGIYIGDNLFIHAASKGKKVQISDLRQRYFSQRLVGARRPLAE